MPAERLNMRRVREILRHRFEAGLGHKSIAVRVGAAPSTVRETLRRLEHAGRRGHWVMMSAMRCWKRHGGGGVSTLPIRMALVIRPRVLSSKVQVS
jgi:hypothetical protein